MSEENDKKDEDGITEIEHSFSEDAVLGVGVDVSVVLGTSMLRVHQLLKLGRGAVVELDQKSTDPVEVYANDVFVARGEVIVVNEDKIGVTLSEMVLHQNSHKIFNKL